MTEKQRALRDTLAQPDVATSGRTEVLAHAKPRVHTPRPLLHVNDLPRPERTRLALGTTCMAAGLVALSAPLAVVWLALFVRSQNWIEFRIADLMALASWVSVGICLPGVCVWVAGFGLLTPPVPAAVQPSATAAGTFAHSVRGLCVGKPTWWPWLVRVCSACWALPPAFIVASVQQGGADTAAGAELARLGIYALFLAAIANAVCCAHLREIALVLCDDAAFNRCLQTMCLLPVLVVVAPLALMPPNLITKDIQFFTLATKGFQGIFLLVGSLAFIFCPCFRYVAAVWSLGACGRWCVVNDIAREEKDNRLRDRAAAVAAAAQAERERLGEHARRAGEQ